MNTVAFSKPSRSPTDNGNEHGTIGDLKSCLLFVGGSRTAPTVRSRTRQDTPGSTQVPRRATSRTHGSWTVREPPLRASLARRSTGRGCTQMSRRATSRTHGVADGSRTAPTGAPGAWPRVTPATTRPGLQHEPPHTVQPAAPSGPTPPSHLPPPLARPPACCTITPVAFTDPLPLLTYCYA